MSDNNLENKSYTNVDLLVYKNTNNKNSTNRSINKLQDFDDLDKFLENELMQNKTQTWSKLHKNTKIKKITEYVISYSNENNLTECESNIMLLFLKDCIDKKKLNKVKEMVYDIDKQKIISIPGIAYVNKRFTLKNQEKLTSKGLGPKKKATKKTHKDNNNNSNDNDDTK